MAIKNDDQENLFYAYVIFPSAYQHDTVPPHRHYAPISIRVCTTSFYFLNKHFTGRRFVFYWPVKMFLFR